MQMPMMANADRYNIDHMPLYTKLNYGLFLEVIWGLLKISVKKISTHHYKG